MRALIPFLLDAFSCSIFVAFVFLTDGGCRLIVMLVSGLLCIPIAGLLGFHMVLIARGCTTNEQASHISIILLFLLQVSK